MILGTHAEQPFRGYTNASMVASIFNYFDLYGPLPARFGFQEGK